jgi:hypothetical protein
VRELASYGNPYAAPRSPEAHATLMSAAESAARDARRFAVLRTGLRFYVAYAVVLATMIRNLRRVEHLFPRW